MDECAIFWSHEFAMRRLLAIVSKTVINSSPEL